MRSLQQYQALDDEDLVDAAKYERPSPQLVQALRERLEDRLAEIASLEFHRDYEPD